jgi:hypothetical protein
MERNRFSVEQIVAILKKARVGISVADLIRPIGIAEQTFNAGRSSTQARQWSGSPS